MEIKLADICSLQRKMEVKSGKRFGTWEMERVWRSRRDLKNNWQTDHMNRFVKRIEVTNNFFLSGRIDTKQL